METKQLFDGGITISAPPGLIDVSDIRPVPDTQEMFMFPDNSGRSILFEILEHVERGKANEDALRYHFNAHAEDTNSTAYDIHSITASSNPTSLANENTINGSLSNTTNSNNDAPPVSKLFGTFKDEQYGHTDAILLLWRIPDHNVDCLLWYFCPKDTGIPGQGGRESRLGVTDEVQRWSEASGRDFKIVDEGLFAD